MILITGASSGIGWQTALKIDQSKLKGDLILVARRLDRLKLLKSKIKRKCHIFSLDLSRPSEIKRFGGAQKALLSKVHTLINNAGLSKGFDLIQEGSFQDWEQTIDTNLKGLLAITQIVLPGMIKRKSGDIVNLGSVAGEISYPRGNVYCATKAAVSSLSECMRMDLLGLGIRVSEICPGMVETEFSEVRLGDKAKAKAVYQGMTPLTGADIADAIVWVLNRPKHFNVSKMDLYPTEQAIPGMVARQT